MQMAVFWVVAPCSLVQVYRRFRDACCLHHQGDHLSSPSTMPAVIIIIIQQIQLLCVL
jgi:hypothetical protein